MKSSSSFLVRALLLLPFALLVWNGAAVASTITYTYDPAGRIVAADYGSGKSTSYAYDNAGNLLQNSQPTPGITVVSLIGNQLTLSWPANPGGFVLQSASSINPVAQWNIVSVTNTPSGNLNSRHPNRQRHHLLPLEELVEN
ncbi:MAG TPA: RHS repeat domain-containing protein [Candidatus Saccharimonadales bacterium]|nr:RHS repeat domain-containing protein [Candidatus Saccharimonadales bacterium]